MYTTELDVEGVIHTVEVILLRIDEIGPVVVELLLPIPSFLYVEALFLVAFQMVNNEVEALRLKFVFVICSALINVNSYTLGKSDKEFALCARSIGYDLSFVFHFGYFLDVGLLSILYYCCHHLIHKLFVV